MLFEDVIEQIHPFGRYQKIQFVLICLIGIPASMPPMVTVFILATPEHRCAIPGLDNDTFASQGVWHDELVKETIPYDSAEKAYSQCSVYVHRNFSHPLITNNATGPCNRWVYSREFFDETVISELNLVCDDKDKSTLANSIMMGGSLMGSLILGSLSDVIGRKKTMILGLVGQFIVTLATGFVNSYEAFVALRFLATFFGVGFYLAAFVSGMELGGTRLRTIAGVVIVVFWCVGLFILLLLAYLLPNWHHLQIAISCVNILFVGHFFLIPESARWLVSRGRLEEASAIIRKAAKVNKADLSEKVLSLQDLQSDGPQEKFLQLFTNCRLLVRCLIIFFNCYVVNMFYYGLGLNVGNLSGNLFLNFMYASIAETLSCVFCLVFLIRIGRRPLHCFSMLLGGGACLAIIFPVVFGNDSHDWITIALAMIGKFGVSAAYTIIYIFSAELFPTRVRNSGVGTSSLCALIGGISSPYIADLGNYVSGDFGTVLQSLIFGVLPIIAGIFAMFLPETLNKRLPDTIEDAISFGRKSTKKSYILNTIEKREEGKDGGTCARY